MVGGKFNSRKTVLYMVLIHIEYVRRDISMSGSSWNFEPKVPAIFWNNHVFLSAAISKEEILQAV